MTEELLSRLLHLEQQTGKCMTSVAECSLSMQKCASDMKTMQQDIKYQNQLSERRLDQIQDLVETQHLILNGNPRQDTKDRGLIGEVEQLKSTDARRKKYYWVLIPTFITVLVSSFWNSFIGNGKEDHGRSEPTETTVQKTSPDTHFLHSDRRSTRRD